MRTLPFYQVDVFTDRPFAGNPLAVFPEAEGLTAVQMQAIASEMNLSETTFVLPPEGDGDARVRIFTPALELPFAGHPSVGTACELVRLRLVDVYEPVTRVVLELGVGPTVVDVAVRDGEPVAATVHQRPPVFHAPAPRGSVAAVLGLDLEDLHPEFDPCRSTPASATRSSPWRRSGRSRRVSLDLELAARLRAQARRGLPVRVHRPGRAVGGGARPVPVRRHHRGPGDRQRRRAARRLHGPRGRAAGRRGARRAPGRPDRPAEPPHGRRHPAPRTPSPTCASAAPCSPCCGASSSSRTDARKPVSGRRPKGPAAHGLLHGRASERAPARRAPRRTDYCPEALVSGRRPEGPRGARTDTIDGL